MDFNSILYEVKGSILTITLNRPDVFNAFNNEQSYELQDALKAAKRDESIRVIVLTGAGKAFCSGQDLKDISGEKRSLSESLYKRYNPIIKAICNMPKPVICKLNGVAAGAGCSLALACDFVVASEKSSLIEVFVAVGLVLDSGSSFFLPQLIGMKRSFEAATMASKITANKALEWGMVNRVASPETLDEETGKIADYYSNSPTKAIAMIKKMLQKSWNSNLDEMLQYEAYCQEIAGNTEDYKEGVNAFVEKRKAIFKGH